MEARSAQVSSPSPPLPASGGGSRPCHLARPCSTMSPRQQNHRLMFMMSSGGLTAAELFQGKDAILSGPAGGVVGMAQTGRAGGFARLIGFGHGRHLDRRLAFRRRVRAHVRD